MTRTSDIQYIKNKIETLIDLIEDPTLKEIYKSQYKREEGKTKSVLLDLHNKVQECIMNESWNIDYFCVFDQLLMHGLQSMLFIILRIFELTTVS